MSHTIRGDTQTTNLNHLSVTILAFVYVPLNLATSVFGMNLKQLNGSGQDLRVFIIIAVNLLAATGGSWFLIEQNNSYTKWQKRSLDEIYDGKTQFALGIRLALFVWLISQGHTNWMFTSGAWWRIIANHNSRMIHSHLPPSDNGCLNACELVSKFQRAAYTVSWFSRAGKSPTIWYNSS